MEVRLSKYIIRAPYNGILTEALVNPGSLVRQGQKLGKFINPSIYELEVAVNSDYIDLLQLGNKVQLHNLENTKSWLGKIIRINGIVDQSSQTVKAFIQVNEKGIREGMYLEARLVAKSENNAYELPRKLLVNNKSVYVIENDTLLSLITVDPVYFNDQTVVIKGLPNGKMTLSKPVPGAYDGMAVKIHKEANSGKKQ